MNTEEVVAQPESNIIESHGSEIEDPVPTQNGELESSSKEPELAADLKDKPSADVESASAAQSKSKSLKPRKKDDCNVQHVLRALNSLTTPEEKLAAMCKKYADLFDENRKLQSSVKQFQKQMTVLVKEKDQVRTDLAKSVLTRSRLESLCRELQRQNKVIKEESYQKIREEEEKRKEVSAKFQVTLNEITELMKQDSDKTMKLRDDNIDMTSKLKSIYEQYEIREQQIEKMAKQMALETQLYEAKLSKMEMEFAAEKEILLREKQQLLMTLTEYQARLQEYQNIELALRNQVALYNNKYEEFEKSLTRSNKMFGGFKEEMENMSDKIIKLEHETAAWKQRWEKTQNALLEMASEKQKSDQEIIVAAKQMSTLHKLCRTLQAERTQLLAKLKQNNISTGSSASETESNTEPLSIDDLPALNDNAEKKSKSSPELKIKKTKENASDKGIIKTRPESNKNKSKLESNDDNVALVDTADTLVNGISNVKITDSDDNSDTKSDLPDEPSSKQEDQCTHDSESEPSSVNGNVDVDESTPQNTSENSSLADSSLNQSNCEIKQFPFPQTDKFSFTYNGNILNELKCNSNQVESLAEDNCCGESSQPFSSPFGDSCCGKDDVENSQKFVLKKSTHSSKRKVSPKKKHKK
ncbi:gamma-taxilin [Planococcus citri]|uniref:gamma-taxilin n=1 Tax=Planococcus citri TaxID=170843 RepID=UPI0031FA2316